MSSQTGIHLRSDGCGYGPNTDWEANVEPRGDDLVHTMQWYLADRVV